MNKMYFKIEKIKNKYIKDLWILRNNRQTRKNSIDVSPITLSSHLKWFKNLDKTINKIFIALDIGNKNVVGYVRFKIMKSNANVSIALFKKYQKRGLSKEILSACENKVKTNYFTAKVRYNNISSVALFSSLNYKTLNKNNGFLIMKKKKNNSSKYLKIIKQIENVRKKNNSNWMDILRIAFKNSPEDAARIMGEIYAQDKKIGLLSKKLSK